MLSNVVRTRGRPRKTPLDITKEVVKKRASKLKEDAKDVVKKRVKNTKKQLYDELVLTGRDIIADPKKIKETVKKRGKNALKVISENTQEGLDEIYNKTRKQVKAGVQETSGKVIDNVIPKKRGRPKKNKI